MSSGQPQFPYALKSGYDSCEAVGGVGPLEASSLLLVHSSSSVTLSLGLEVRSGEGAGVADETSWSPGNTVGGGGQPERCFSRKDRLGR